MKYGLFAFVPEPLDNMDKMLSPISEFSLKFEGDIIIVKSKN